MDRTGPGRTHGLAFVIILLIMLAAVLFETDSIVLNTTTSTTSTIHSAPNITTTVYSTDYTIPQPSNYSTGRQYSANQTIEYALQLINSVRLRHGLQSVTLSNESSGQQHAESMLRNDYFSHWDLFGMKPYMRYTLLGGQGSVNENIAYNSYFHETCIAYRCSVDQINVTDAVGNMESQMLYNDSLCCNNGHRDNILDPNHNQVSIGIAYNRTSVYFVEDFIDNYINWTGGTPASRELNVSLSGQTLHNTGIRSVQVSYEPLPKNMSKGELANTSSYSYGGIVGGVTYGRYYYRNITTIYANQYSISGTSFNIDFSLAYLYGKYGPGVYTIMLYLDNSTGGTFLGSTYSLFMRNGSAFTPGSV